MATRTSSQAGNTHNSPFAFGSAVNSDDVLIINHNVAVDANVTVGQAVCPAPPTSAPTASATTGGSITAGSYDVAYAHVDSNGNESFAITAFRTVIISGGNNAISITLPSLPSGVASYNLYTLAGPLIYKLTGYQAVAPGTTTITTYSGGATRVTPASIYVNNGKTLTINAGVTLTNKGHIALDGGQLVMTDGASLVMDPVTTGEIAYVTLGEIYDRTNTLVSVTGSSGSHCAIGAVTGERMAFSGGVGSVSPGRDSMKFNVAYCDFTRVGSASVPFVNFQFDTGAQTTILFANCTFTSCGLIGGVTSIPATGGWSFTDCTWSGSVDTTVGYDIRLIAYAASGSPTRLYDRCVFDKSVWTTASGATMTDCFLSGGYQGDGSSWASFARNFLWIGKAGSAAILGLEHYGDMTDCYVLADTTNGNSHVIIARTSGTYSGLIFDNTSDDTAAGDTSDLWIASTAVTPTLINSILAFSEIQQNGAGAINFNAPSSLNVRHCSAIVSGALVYLGDVGFGVDTLKEFKSNLIVGSPGFTNWKVEYITQIVPVFENAMTGANAVYNAGYNLSVGAAGKNYNTKNTDHAPGDNDIDLDASGGPGCANVFVNAGQWALARGYSATTGMSDANIRARYADAITALKADFVARNADLLAYIRACWAPTNVLLKDAGHDGVTIGAVEYQAAGVTSLIGGGIGSGANVIGA